MPGPSLPRRIAYPRAVGIVGPIDLAALRWEYGDQGLTPDDLGPNPISAFTMWLSDAARAGLHEPNAMVVASVGESGAPSARLVLLKAVDERGFVFYTNYESRKAGELLARPACALLFPWHPLQRQVRVEGVAEQVDAGESDAYFASRPRPAQLGAWASPQSRVVPDREFLEARYAAAVERFDGAEAVSRPTYWGGFRVRPQTIEFWQGRPGRMHDRVRFRAAGEATRGAGATAWTVERLAP